MKIKPHLDIIKNFCEISPAMVFTSDKIKIINQSDSIFANYVWGETLPIEKFGIHRVREFTQIVSLFDDPDMELKEIEKNPGNYDVIITGSNRKSKYGTTEPDLIKYSDKEIKEEKLGEPNITFKLSKSMWKEIKDSANVIQAKHMVFNINTNNELRILLTDQENSASNNYEILISQGEYEGTIDADVVMYTDDFKIIEGEYEVKIYKDKVFKYYEAEKKVTYYISLKR